MRFPLAVLALVVLGLVSLGNSNVEGADAPRKRPKVSLSINGPSSVTRNESLELLRFRAVLTNRGAAPVLLFVRNDYLLNANWNWTVTDAEGTPMGMELVNHGFCGTVPYSEEAAAEARRVRDKDLVTLAPGESREFPIPGGPSDDYNFPAPGTYRFAVTLAYLPPNAAYLTDEQGQRQKAYGFEQWDLSQLSVNGAAALQRSFSLQATSNAWDVALPTARPHKNAVILLPPVALSELVKP
jgi:hypothetical protein